MSVHSVIILNNIIFLGGFGMGKKLNEDRSGEVLAAIKKHWEDDGNGPTFREIGELTGIKSTSLISFYLNQLVREGKVIRDSKKARSIFPVQPEITKPVIAPVNKIVVKPVGMERRILSIPDFGPIAAGIPLHLPDASYKATDRTGMDHSDMTIEIPESYIPEGVEIKDIFALHVQGNSMRDAMLIDGDIVLILKTKNVKTRDVVAAWIIEDHETTLKRLEITERGIWLRPENPNFEPYFYLPDQVEIQGKLLAVLRFRY
jgi:repressor LexA